MNPISIRNAAIGVITLFVVLIFSTISFSNDNGAPVGKTGSPGDGNVTCAQGGCHTGSSVVSETGWITTNIPASGFVKDTVYTISATATGAGVTIFGFEICAEKGDGTKVGTWSLINTTNTKFAASNIKYVTHTLAGSAGSGTKTWSQKWKAPASGIGDVTFYAAFNNTNNDGTKLGDVIHTSSVTVHDFAFSVNDPNSTSFGFSVYPNPAKDYIHINAPLNSASYATLELINVEGKTVQRFFGQEGNMENISKEFQLAENLAPGLYFLNLRTDEKVLVEKLVIGQ